MQWISGEDTAGFSMKKYWVGQKFHSGFSVTSYGKIQRNLWPTQTIWHTFFENWLCCRPFVGACVLRRFRHVQLFASLCPIAHQTPLSMGFSRQEYWSGMPCPPWGLPDPGIETAFLMSLALAGRFFTTSTT